MKPLLLLDPEKLTHAEKARLKREGFDTRTVREASLEAMQVRVPLPVLRAEWPLSVRA